MPTDIHPLTPDRHADLAELFCSNSITRGCWCSWFLQSAKEVTAGWGDGNRHRFETLMRDADPPAGLIAYHEGQPVAWCATGPRTRYPRAVRSKIMQHRDQDEDTAVWLVPCFFVRVGFRRQGFSKQLLSAVVEHARDRGATAVEGFPLAGDGKHQATDRFLGTEPLFAACGFTAIARPSPRRVIMRLDLSNA